MWISIDIIIVVIFLVTTLGAALRYGSGVKTIEEYALGGRNFSNTALIATIVATWVSGSLFFNVVSSFYSKGLSYLIPTLCMPVQILLTAFFFVPRMGEFLGDLTVAESMGKLYGKHVRFISAICGIAGNVGGIAVQFKVFATLFSVLLDKNAQLPSEYTLILASTIVIIYSAFGGIKAVIYTDVVQFFTFSFVIPVIGIIIWNNFVSLDLTYSNVSQSPIFSLSDTLSLGNPNLLEMLFLMMYFAYPNLGPMEFQRISIGKTLQQAKKTLIISAFLLVLITIFLAWIPFLLFNINPNMDSNHLLSYIIDNYAYTGFKGLIIIGVAAMAMSTADSRINASSVLFAHDIAKILNIKVNELTISKIFSLLLGISAIYLALSKGSLLSIVMMSASFYMPTVSIPFAMSVLGFRSSSKSVLIGMGAGITSVFLWDYLDTGIHKIIPSMLLNLVFLLLSHYLLRQPGGWVGIKDTTYLDMAKNQRLRQKKKLYENIKKFHFLTFCVSRAPKDEVSYCFFGIFCFVSSLSSIYSSQGQSVNDHYSLLLFLYQSLLVVSSFFMLFMIWTPRIKNKAFVAVAWHFAMIYILCFCSSFFLLISHFGKLQLVVFTLNVMVLFLLTGWRTAIFMILTGVVLAIKAYEYFFDISHIGEIFNLFTGNVIYVLLLMSTALITIFKPKQDVNALIEAKMDYQSDKIIDQKKELQKAIDLKHEFLRNLQHETRTPIIGITSMGQVLDQTYDQLPDSQKREAIREIARSSTRLSSLVNNLIDLSQLQSASYQLDKSKVDLTETVYQRIELCRKLYIDQVHVDKQEFILNIEDDVFLYCDEHYIVQVIDNIIINAIQYCPEGKITIVLKYDLAKKTIEFSVQDEGIGIPTEDLNSVFGPFIVSSRTRTSAGGRGIGLALCKRVVELHGGDITVIPNPEKGVTFTVILPHTL